MKRILSLILAIAMVLSMVPAQAFATEPTEETVAETVAETTVPETEQMESVPTTETTLPSEPETEPSEQSTVPTETAAKTTAPETVPETTVPEETVSEEMTEEAAGDVIASGRWTGGREWVLEDTGVLTISGTGEAPPNSGWIDYASMITCVVYEDGITAIGTSLYGLKNLKKLVVPASVKSIGSNAFYDCTRYITSAGPIGSGCAYEFGWKTEIVDNAFNGLANLKDVRIPDTVTRIGNYAFRGCAIAQIALPEGVTFIGKEAFLATKLTSIIIPDKVTYIGDLAFRYTYSLISVTLPTGLKYLGEGAFNDAEKLTSIEIPEGVTELNGSVFADCEKLQNVHLPEGLTKIGDYAFDGCLILPSVTIPKGVTYIGSSAFGDCRMLKNLVLPESVKEIGSSAFQKCNNLKSITLPKSVDSLGTRLFYSCTKLEEVILPGGITSVPEYTFYGCKLLKTVAIPKGITSIGYNAFRGCAALTDVYFGGSEEEWNALAIDRYNTELNDAVIHFNVSFDPVYYSELRFYDRWDASLQRVYFSGKSSAVTEETDAAFRADPTALLNSYVMVDVKSRWGAETLISMHPVQVITGIVSAADATTIVVNGVTYSVPEDADAPENYVGSYVLCFVFNGQLIRLKKLSISDYVDNNAIVINGSGSAYAYYETAPNQIVAYSANGAQGKATADARGILCIPLGTFRTPMEHKVPVEISQIGEAVFDPAVELMATVKVKELSYTESWKLSMDAMVGVAVNAGLPTHKIEATLGKAGISAGGGAAIGVTQEHDDGKDSLELTSEFNGKVETEFSLGPKVGTEENNFTLASVSSKLSGGVTGSYSMKFEEYSVHNPDQQKAIAIFFLGEMLRVKNNSIIYWQLYETIKDQIYENSGAVFSNGRGAGLSGSAGGTLGQATVDGNAVFSSGGVSVSTTASFDKKRNSLGERERSASYQVDGSLDVFAVETKWNGFDLDQNAVIGWDMLGVDTTITAKNLLGGDTLEATYLTKEAAGFRTFFIDKYYTSVYKNLTFRKDVLDYLKAVSPSYRAYVNGTNDILGVANIMELASFVSNNPMMIPYSEKTKQQVLLSVPLNIGLGIGLEADMDLTFSYLETSEYDSATGFVKGDRTLLTSQSDNYNDEVLANHTGLPELIVTALSSIWEKAAEFFETVYGIAREGIRTVWCWITGNPDSKYDRRVSVTSARGGGGGGGIRAAWALSYNVDTLSNRERTALASGIVADSSADYAMSKAATIGRPFVIGVEDNKTGERVADFSDEPLEFTIRYAEEDLEAAGLSSRSDVVLDGGIAMYRYVDEGNYFEYVGGTNDLAAMTVTAEITKPGQYVLAVDSCAPALSALELSDYRATPTVTAYIDDLSGLDVSKFVFKLDGAVKVDGKNIAQHFNSEAGLFTYTVTTPLAEGQHTMSFTLADTTGNTETYEYTFYVDLTAPVVSDVTVEGYTNEGSVVEIRARASDENLSGVYAMLSRKLTDGSWSPEVGVEMGDMGGGLWGVDYEGDGASVRVRICATDLADNETYSETFEANPYAESVEIAQDYLALRVGLTKQLAAEVKPAELAGTVQWSVDDETVISVDATGNVTAKKPGTAYVIAAVTDGEKEMTARCRVDVAQSLKLEGVKLGGNKLTAELYSTDYTKLDILLMLPQNYAAAAAGASAEQTLSAAISEAYFTDPALAELFSLNILDDRTLEIVPTDVAISSEKIAKSYSGTVTVTVEGTSYVTDELTLAVKTSLPKLKVTVPAFNSFCSGQSQTIQVTGATVTDIRAADLPEWLALGEKQLYLTEKAPRKNASAKVSLEIWTEEWAVPVHAAVAVKNTYKAPGLKLSASSVQLSDQPGSSAGVTLQLLPKNKKETLSDLRVCGISAPEGYRIENYADGTFTLKPESGFIPGKINLEVSFFDTGETVQLPITVKAAQVKLKPAVSSVSLNAEVGDSALVGIAATPTDYVISGPAFRLVDGTGSDKLSSGELEIRFEDGAVRINTTDRTPIGGNYTLFLKAGGSREVAIKIKTLGGAPALSLKQSSNLDLSFDAPAVITPAYKNYAGGRIAAFKHTVMETKSGEDATGFFEVTEKSGRFYLTCTNTAAVSEKGAYVLNLKLTLVDGREQEASLKLKIKRTAIRLKLNPGKLTLNKAVNDTASVAVSCNLKDYELVKPVWQLMDKTGKQSAEGKLDISWNDGKLRIGTNANTEYGATYKLLVAPEAGATPTALTVAIPAEAKSNVTATVTVKGSLDVIRRGEVLVIPGYKNVSTETARAETLRILRSDNKVVTDQFNIVKNHDGTYAVSIADGAEIDLTKKYQIQLTAIFGSLAVSAKPGNLSIKMGSAKVTAQVKGTLFAEDRSSRVTLTFSSSDEALKDVARIEIKDAKNADIFEIFDYGNGRFAIGFKNGQPVRSAKPITLSLNIFLEGNTTAKPNATGKLKISIVP